MGMILVAKNLIRAKNPISDETSDARVLQGRLFRFTRLGCVLGWSDIEPVRILYPSFTDFLLNRDSGVWYIAAQSTSRISSP